MAVFQTFDAFAVPHGLAVHVHRAIVVAGAPRDAYVIRAYLSARAMAVFSALHAFARSLNAVWFVRGT